MYEVGGGGVKFKALFNVTLILSVLGRVMDPA